MKIYKLSQRIYDFRLGFLPEPAIVYYLEGFGIIDQHGFLSAENAGYAIEQIKEFLQDQEAYKQKREGRDICSFTKLLGEKRIFRRKAKRLAKAATRQGLENLVKF